jgi:hypothetical protein
MKQESFISTPNAKIPFLDDYLHDDMMMFQRFFVCLCMDAVDAVDAMKYYISTFQRCVKMKKRSNEIIAHTENERDLMK